jgi:hypothetical protein
VTDSAPASAQLLRADRFHAGVRVATLVVWVFSIVVAYVVLGLIATPFFGPIGGLGILLLLLAAVIVAQPLAWLAEKQLLAHWPSGRSAQLEPGALIWRDRGPAIRLDLGQKVNYWRWRFHVGKRRKGRVPGNSHCFAVRLVQGDTVVAFYTFLAPASADALAARFSFYELRRPSDPSKSPLGGRDAIYMAAEHSRWETGAELEPADFEVLIGHLAAYLPDFPRSAQSGV